jgi:hypothetical protein
MLNSNKDLIKRYHSLKRRISAITSLRYLVNIPPEADLTERQWNAIESQLSLLRIYLYSNFIKNAEKYLENLNNPEVQRKFNYFLGDMQLKLAKSYDGIFDLFFDILTQKCSKLGIFLAGCEVLAFDAIRQDHTLLESIEPPIVTCNIGYASSTFLQGTRISYLPHIRGTSTKTILPPELRLFNSIQNPVPLIQIPWQKPWYGLPSLLHEVAHQIIRILDLTKALRHAFSLHLDSRVPSNIKKLFVNCVPEILSDFCSFSCVGLAQTFTTIDILSLPPNHVFYLSNFVHHPPPYLRVLLSIEWSNQLWGKQLLENLRKKWINRYPLTMLSLEKKKFFEKGIECLPIISEVMLNTKFTHLNGRRIIDLFDIKKINPWRLGSIAQTVTSGNLNLSGLSPCQQLGVFGIIREKYDFTEEIMDNVMRKWLIKLAKSRNYNNTRDNLIIKPLNKRK